MYGNMQPELAACNLDLDAIWHKKKDRKRQSLYRKL